MTFDSIRAGSCVMASEPSPLLTLMMTGSADRRSSGRNAVVVRTTPTTLTSKTPKASAAVRALGSPTGPLMPALLIRTSIEPSCSATFAAAAATEASSVTSMGTNRAPSAAAASAPSSALRAPTRTVWPSATRRRAVSRPSPLFAPVMKVIVMESTFVPSRRPGQGRLDGRNSSTTSSGGGCGMMDVMTAHSPTQLGAMIRTWRDRLPPSAAGLPAARSRRAAGLRREELAELAGMSVDYVVRLEQGRATTPSASVVAALARALQLSTAERDHLYRLARLAPPADGAISDHIPPGVHRVLTRLGDVAVAVFAADWQLIWWNRGWAALLGDPSSTPREHRNFARDSFPINGDRPRLSQWPVTSLARDTVDAAIVSDLRRATGRFPNSSRLTNLVRVLTAGSQRFAELWDRGAV